MDISDIYNNQDEILTRILNNRNPPFDQMILAGGTALSRFYLNHRISTDLDFFVPSGFNPERLEIEFTNLGMPLSDVSRIPAGQFVAQLHGWAQVSAHRIKVSVFEDLFAGMFEQTVINNVRTEHIDGLYHRKLRTISGTGNTINSVGQTRTQGGRQNARDLYDLYVLDYQQEPIHEFIQRIKLHGVDFSVNDFAQGIARMRWLDLMDEFEQLETLPPFQKITAHEAKRYFDRVLRSLPAL